MYAVIRTGGKQYRVAKDDVISVEKLAAEAGATVELDQVLMIGGEADATVGAPLVDGARVVATVLEQTRGDKVIVFKKRRRKGISPHPGPPPEPHGAAHQRGIDRGRQQARQGKGETRGQDHRPATHSPRSHGP